MTADFVIERLAAHHDKLRFSSGVEALDRYLRDQAGQDERRLVANCFVVATSNGDIAGFYSFAATNVPVNALADEERRKLPRYPNLPAALIGRLAVDLRFQGQGLGAAMIIDAGWRALRADPAVFALVVDAKNIAAAEFYRHIKFRPFPDHPLRLFLPLGTLRRLFAK